MIRVILTAVFYCLPSLVSAQTVIVRSGEHVDFTRLTFEFPAPVEWKIGRDASGYAIKLQMHDPDIDISGVFRRISRSRISSISVSNDDLLIHLKLSCDCHADAFEFKPNFLVVDIKDGPPTETSLFEETLKTDEVSTRQPNHEKISDIALETAKNSILLPIVTPHIGSYSSAPSGNHYFQPATTERTDAKERVAKIQSEMLLQIGRAASQGLLVANMPDINPVPNGDEKSIHQIIKVEPAEIPHHTNIHIENSIDREFSRLQSSKYNSAEISKCLPDNILNIIDWGDANSVWAHITEQRSKLTGEFDRSNAQAVERLAKAYIFAGFGAEAQKVISGFNVDLENAHYFTTLAQIVDGTPPSDLSRLSGQLECESSSAFWAVLAVPELSAQAPVNQKFILHTFSSLPLHLRRQLGPRLAQKFLDSGDLETAQSIKNAITRAAGNVGHEFKILEARLLQERGQHSQAELTLNDIVLEGERASPLALIELIEARLESKKPISADLLSRLASYIFEQPDTKIGAKLTRAFVLAHAQSGELSKALEALLRLSETKQFDSKAISLIWDRTLNSATVNAPDEAFLRFIFDAHEELAHQRISHNSRRQAANRLLKSGLPKMAKKLLAASTSPSVADRLVLAQAERMDGHPEQVANIMNLAIGEDAARIRAGAYEDMGHYLDAAREYASIGDSVRQHAAIWRAKNWEELVNTGSNATKYAAEIMLNQNQSNHDSIVKSGGAVENNSSLISTSKDARESIETLLKEYPAPSLDGS